MTIPQPRCSITFRVSDEKRYQSFAHFFKTLRAWSQRRSQSLLNVMDTQEIAIANPTALLAAEETFAARTFNLKNYDRPESWMLALRPQDIQVLGLPTHAESIRHLQQWGNLNRKERRLAINSEPTLQQLADFADMLRQFESAEYEIAHLERVGMDTARLEFIPIHYPYEGKEAIEGLLLFFGFFSIVDEQC